MPIELSAVYLDFLQRGGVADLSERTLLELRGADRVRYLNGQVTSNVAKLSAGTTQPACVTTAKGRLCAEIRITATPDALRIDADTSLAASLPARLERYIVADDVTLEELPPDTCLLHFIGQNPAELPAFAGLVFHAARRFGPEGWDLWSDAAGMATLWPKIHARFVSLPEPILESLRLEHGIARWGRELDEDTLPPEAGLERTHIDYHKGCYIGQETISRLKSIGHVNRQLLGFCTPAEAPAEAGPLAAGMRLLGPDSPADKPLGTLTSVAWSFALEKPIALGYLKRGAPMDALRACLPETPAASFGLPVCAQPLPFVS